MTKKKVAFICVHNSCRSQIAEHSESIYEVKNLIFTLPERKLNRR